jgi:two-component system sensor histidine kinase/response regulator
VAIIHFSEAALPNPLRVLIIEDSADDLALILRTLRHGGYEPTYLCVDGRQALTTALALQDWDIILTDSQMPGFSGDEAVDLICNTLAIDIPVIVVSGAIGEEHAVGLMKAGAQDYVLKDKLSRLPMAIEREIAASRTRSEKRASEKQLIIERENFISIVAHDLRSPVQRIETMVQLLRDDYGSRLDDDGKDIVFRIERSACRLRLMLSSLLAYSRCGRAAINGKIASLPNTLEEILDNMGISKANADIELTFRDINWVKGDAILIGHVIENLFSNALKFRLDGKRFKVSVDAERIENSKVQISVTDNGIGIEPRFAEKVFEIFYRLHHESEYEGTGIGLAICKKIVSDHSGKIWVDTSYSPGARIVFTLESADFADVGPNVNIAEAFALS